MRISDWSSDVCSSDLDMEGADPGEDRELRDLLNKAMQHLSAEQRVVVELVYGVGHSLNEVAAIVQCPVGTFKARLFHARVTLLNVLPALSGEDGAREGGRPCTIQRARIACSPGRPFRLRTPL